MIHDNKNEKPPHHKQKEYHINGLGDIFRSQHQEHQIILFVIRKPSPDACFTETFTSQRTGTL